MAEKATKTFKLLEYISIDDSGDDSAYGHYIIGEHEGTVLVHAGPGFYPDGSNRPGYAWGGVIELDDPNHFREYIADDVPGAGDPQFPFPNEDWSDQSKVEKLFEHLITNAPWRNPQDDFLLFVGGLPSPRR